MQDQNVGFQDENESASSENLILTGMFAFYPWSNSKQIYSYKFTLFLNYCKFKQHRWTTQMYVVWMKNRISINPIEEDWVVLESNDFICHSYTVPSGHQVRQLCLPHPLLKE